MAEKREAELVWKPKAALYFSLFFLLVSVFFWGLLFFGADSDKTLSNWILTSIYFFPALFGTIYGARTRVECDENGIRWRDWHGFWRAAEWEEISDFYKRASKSESGSTHTVQTSQGNLEFGLEGDGKAIAELIAERAVNAPIREWEIKGERLIDEWPRRFMFFHSGLGSASRYAFLVLTAVNALTIYLLWFRMPPRADISPSSYFLAYAAPILMLPILPFLFWLYFLTQARQARPFRDQSLEVSPSGLVFHGVTRVETTWAQIEAWSWSRRGKIRFLRLQTADDNIEIPTFIGDFRSLCRVMERFSGVSILKAQEEESAAVLPVQTAPDKTLVFSFNNLGIQTMSWLFAPMGLAMFATPFLMRWADPQTPPRDEAGFLFFGIVMFLLSLGWMWFLRVASLRLTPDFLEWRAPFLRRAVAWQDIESFGSTPSQLDWVIVSGKKRNLSLLWLPISQRSRLHAEIEKRAFNATGEWQTETPSRNN